MVEEIVQFLTTDPVTYARHVRTKLMVQAITQEAGLRLRLASWDYRRRLDVELRRLRSHHEASSRN